MGTHKHGLPTSLDDEVLVGLIQLTKRRSNFTDARVQFSRYELIELLGWPQSGQSYRRIEEALHRWVGVVLMYENAWWDNAAKSWVDEQFHVLDNVTLYDRERWRTSARSGRSGKGDRGGSKADKPPLPLSSFRWNEVIFQSFQSGNLKQLDLEFYLKLRLPTTKRMYRFLDKRFYRRSRLDFDLRTLACEHIGLSRSYAPTELKRRLKPALEELEQLGFLEPLGPEERYSYVKRGCWRIIFIRGSQATAEAQDPAARQEHQPGELIEALKARGITARTAQELVEAHPPGRIRTKIEVFDWLLKNEDQRVGKNPAGYLVASIRSDYQAPVDYQAKARRGQGRGPGQGGGRGQGAAGAAPRPRRGRRSTTRPARSGSAPPGSGCPRPSARRSGRRQGREPRPRPLEEHARAPLPGRARGPDGSRAAPPRRGQRLLFPDVDDVERECATAGLGARPASGGLVASSPSSASGRPSADRRLAAVEGRLGVAAPRRSRES